MTKISLKKLNDKKQEKVKRPKKILDKKAIKIAFDILAIFSVIIFSMTLMQKAFQNDTFYTVKIGQLIRNNGIDYLDHFSWHESLPYMYPHWLYDVITSLIYDFAGGFRGIYIANVLLTAILGVCIYIANKKISKNQILAFVITLGQMYLMKGYFAARAQLLTFVLFAIAIIFIEKFLEKPKVIYGAILVIIPIIIANVHSAVWPFYFVLFMPYIGEYLLRIILDAHIPHNVYKIYLKQRINRTNKKLKKANKEKAVIYHNKLTALNKSIQKSNEQFDKFVIKQNSRRKNPYKLSLEKNNNVLKLIVVMIICLFTGLLTPIKDMPYTYTLKIMQGTTTKSINEHLPLTLIDNKPLLTLLAICISMGIFTKVKLRFRDVLFISGLTLLALMTRRQVSMLVLFGGLFFCRILSDFVAMYDKNGTEDLKEYMTSLLGEILTIILIGSLSYCMYREKINQEYINEKEYPIEASKWIKENIDYKNMKIFNDYNYGSYMLLNDIPVFIDSRCDLYTPEFNGTYNKEKKKYEGQNIFGDYMDISSIATDYDNKFDQYKITHVITKANSKLNMLIKKDKEHYNEIYKDSDFIVYERNTKSETQAEE